MFFELRNWDCGKGFLEETKLLLWYFQMGGWGENNCGFSFSWCALRPNLIIKCGRSLEYIAGKGQPISPFKAGQVRARTNDESDKQWATILITDKFPLETSNTFKANASHIDFLESQLIKPSLLFSIIPWVCLPRLFYSEWFSSENIRCRPFCCSFVRLILRTRNYLGL